MTIFQHFISLLLVSAASFPLVLLVRYLYNRNKRIDKKEEALKILLIIYIICVFSQTLLPFEYIRLDFTSNQFHLPESKYIALLPFRTFYWYYELFVTRSFDQFAINVISNIILFIPFGILFPLCFKNREKLTVLYGFLLSVFIEFIQLFSDRSTETADVILNTLGVAIGYLIIKLVIKICNRRKVN